MAALIPDERCAILAIFVFFLQIKTQQAISWTSAATYGAPLAKSKGTAWLSRSIFHDLFLRLTSFINVQVSGSPTRDETEELTSLWQTGLWNSHIQADRFLLEDDRAIFMFKVGQVVSAVASQLRDHGFNAR